MIIDNIEYLHNIDDIDNIELMEKIFDRELVKFSKNQLLVLKYFLLQPNTILTSVEIAKRTKILQKHLGGVLSALSRKKINGLAIIEPMGRDERMGLRWRLITKVVTVELAIAKVKQLLSSYN